MVLSAGSACPLLAEIIGNLRFFAVELARILAIAAALGSRQQARARFPWFEKRKGCQRFAAQAARTTTDACAGRPCIE
jgi:hypothetical protein